MSYRIQLIQLAGGPRTDLDGKWLMAYRPELCKPVLVETEEQSRVFFSEWIEATDELDEAMEFEDSRAALELLRTSVGTRPDGKPDRPITMFTVAVERG